MVNIIEALSFINLLIFSLLISRIDIREKRIPNKYLFTAIAISLILRILTTFSEQSWGKFFGDLLFSTIFTLVFLFTHLIYPSGVGMGDVKAVFWISLSLSPFGINTVALSIMFSFLSASLFIILVKIVGRRDLKDFAFGPFLFAPATVMFGISAFLQ